MTISVIIPTYQRPQMLKDAVNSVLKQSVRAGEIVIGDDSKDDATEKLVREELMPRSPVPIRYFHHRPSLGQGMNVDRLIQLAEGELIAVLHDDDFFCDGAFSKLVPCLSDPQVAVAYGKQQVATADGVIKPEASEELNAAYYRTAEYGNARLDFFEAALLQQFPNDGFLIRAYVAKKVGYARAMTFLGDACDHAFSILCAEAFPAMHAMFVNEYTAVYRESASSVMRSNPHVDASFRAFQYVTNLPAEIVKRSRVQQWLRNQAGPAVAQACTLGHKRLARQWYFSPWHRPKILTPGGIKRGLKLI